MNIFSSKNNQVTDQMSEMCFKTRSETFRHGKNVFFHPGPFKDFYTCHLKFYR